MHKIADQMLALEGELNNYFLERREVIRAALLAILAGEHLFILGLPGATKSKLIRAIVGQIVNARYFEVALSKRRPADAVFGPLNLMEFRTTGNYWLRREGYASQVEFAMLDEIGKMSDVLGHDMLALLNERVYHEVRDGRSVHDSPLSTAFTASNEMLTGQSDDAAALWDRLLIRVQADYITERGNFAALLGAGEKVNLQTVIEWSQLREVITDVVPGIKIGDGALEALVNLRFEEFHRAGIIISDRRWKQSIKALQASAFLAGRDEVTAEDLAVLRFTHWDTVEQRAKVERLAHTAASPFAPRLYEMRDVLDTINEELGAREQLESGDINRRDYAPDATRKLDSIRLDLDTMLMEAQGRPVPMFKAVSDMHRDTLVRLYTGILEMDRTLVETKVIQDLLGQGDGGNV